MKFIDSCNDQIDHGIDWLKENIDSKLSQAIEQIGENDSLTLFSNRTILQRIISAQNSADLNQLYKNSSITSQWLMDKLVQQEANEGNDAQDPHYAARSD